jgi:tRNA nucleotidyltransferase/poly(A) polymerase
MGLGEDIAEFLDDAPASSNAEVEKTEGVDEKVEKTPESEQSASEGEKQEENSTTETEKKAEEVAAKGADGERGVEEKGKEKEEKEKKVDKDDDRTSLLNEIARLSSLVQEGGKKETKGEEGKTEEPQVTSFVKTEEDLRKIFESPDTFNKFLSDFASRVQEISLRGIPVLVGNVARHTVTVQSAVQDFYKRNPEFANIKPFVALTVNELEGENPGKGIGEIMALAETRLKEKLRMTKKEKTEEKEKESPAFVKGKQGGGGSRGGGKPNSNSQSAQIGALIER